MFLNWKFRYMERISKRKFFHPVIHSLRATMARAEPMCSQEPGDFSGSLTQVQGPKAQGCALMLCQNTSRKWY